MCYKCKYKYVYDEYYLENARKAYRKVTFRFVPVPSGKVENLFAY